MAVGIFHVRNCINLVLSVDPMKPKLRKILCGKIFFVLPDCDRIGFVLHKNENGTENWNNILNE